MNWRVADLSTTGYIFEMLTKLWFVYSNAIFENLNDIPLTSNSLTNNYKLTTTNDTWLQMFGAGLYHFRIWIVENSTMCQFEDEVIVFVADEPVPFPGLTLFQFSSYALFVLLFFIAARHYLSIAILPLRPGTRERPMESPLRTLIRQKFNQVDASTTNAIEFEMQALMESYEGNDFLENDEG